MYEYTPDEVMQVEVDDLRTELKELKATKCKSEPKDIHDINFVIGKCYEIHCSNDVKQAILLGRIDNTLYFATTGEGRIGAILRVPKYIDVIIEESIVNNSAIMVIDLDSIFKNCVYVRELI